jgi:hypothetical protein
MTSLPAKFGITRLNIQTSLIGITTGNVTQIFDTVGKLSRTCCQLVEIILDSYLRVWYNHQQLADETGNHIPGIYGPRYE